MPFSKKQRKGSFLNPVAIGARSRNRAAPRFSEELADARLVIELASYGKGLDGTVWF